MGADSRATFSFNLNTVNVIQTSEILFMVLKCFVSFFHMSLCGFGFVVGLTCLAMTDILC